MRVVEVKKIRSKIFFRIGMLVVNGLGIKNFKRKIMKTSVRVALNISKVKDEELDLKVQTIIQNMTGNANFPAPLPELDALTLALTAYQAALVARQSGSKEDTARKNEKRSVLEAALRELGNVVDNKSKSDLSVLLSSGFDARKQRTAVFAARLEKPSDIKIEFTQNTGSLKVSVAKIANARSYLFQYAPAPITAESQWISVPGVARTKVLDGLEVGKLYSFRVGGIGPDPVVVFSDVVEKFAA